MPDEISPAAAVLEALGCALFLRDETGALPRDGRAPEWLAQLWPGAELPPPDASPFLENFLIDARECWSGGADARAESGPWIERDAAGGEVQLQATALTAGGRACLLIERLGEAFASKVSVLQKARETVIALQRLDAEIQKKEILVHCLAEDLSAGLGNIVTSLRLLELEENPPRTLELLALALRSAQEQRSLIGKMLDLFTDELGGLYGRAGEALAKSDLRRALTLAMESVAPHFSEKGVRLLAPEASAEVLRVPAEEAHVVRVVANLFHNALENTATGGEIAVRISEEAETALLTVEHPGGAAGTLAARFDPSSAPSPEAFLRLHFCRIAVESCHGEMGFAPGEDGGNCVWVRLPKWSAAP